MKRRGFVSIVAAGMAVVAVIVAIALITGLISALAQSFMGRVAGLFGGFSFSGSYETTNLLDGLPIETTGKMAIESHMALTPGDYDMPSHFAKTNTDQIFANNKVGLKLVKSNLLKAFETSAFIAELGGQLPPEDETWYINQRWCYVSSCFMGRTMGSKADYVRKKVVVTNPKNGKSVVTSVLDWGPNARLNRVAGISPEASAVLGVDTDATLTYGWAVDQSVPLGPVNANPTSQSGGSVTTTDVGDGLQRTSKNFPRFMQFKGPWAGNDYSFDCESSRNTTVSSSGCGPSSLANVVLYYQEARGLKFTDSYTKEFGNAVNPGIVAKLAQRHGYRQCGGTANGVFNGLGSRYFNLRADVSNWTAAANALRQKIPVVALTHTPCDGCKGYFSSGGHFVVLYDISPDGQTIYVSDSYKRNIKEAPLDIVKSQADTLIIMTPR